MTDARKNILWLVSWYPNLLEPLTGDFIERHARAASLLNNIHVLFAARDHLNRTTGKMFIERRNYPESATATILYYKANNPVISGLKYLWHLRKLVKEYISANGKPALINVHISYRAGVAALYCKWFLGINYVVTEHWTIFCKEAKPGFKDGPFIQKWLIRLIYKNASKCSSVSRYLGDSLREKFDIEPPVRIPNVVNTKLFFPSSQKKADVFRFIHISLMNYQKSPDEIFQAVRRLQDLTISPFELIIYGPIKQIHTDRVKQLELDRVIQFRGEVAHDILSRELRVSNALILYSRYETFGCVIIEAYASGVPVIVSDIPVMHEIVNERTGVFARPENPGDLAEKMLWMMNNHQLFNAGDLARLAEEKYGFQTVAEHFDKFYKTN